MYFFWTLNFCKKKAFVVDRWSVLSCQRTADKFSGKFFSFQKITRKPDIATRKIL